MSFPSKKRKLEEYLQMDEEQQAVEIAALRSTDPSFFEALEIIIASQKAVAEAVREKEEAVAVAVREKEDAIAVAGREKEEAVAEAVREKEAQVFLFLPQLLLLQPLDEQPQPQLSVKL
jgi:LytS/YehU family sensor histidine kinase